jgi:hypothetical protein
MIDRAGRKIDRERGKIEMAEKKQMKEIQKLAKLGQHVSISSITYTHFPTKTLIPLF